MPRPSAIGNRYASMALIDRKFAERFAQEWIEAWNSHDLDRNPLSLFG